MGTYTLQSMTLTCAVSSTLQEITGTPPEASGSLNIKEDNTFTWTISLNDDGTGTIPDCLGVQAVSLNMTGTVSELNGALTFDAGTEIAKYNWNKNGTTLNLTDVAGEDSYVFVEM